MPIALMKHELGNNAWKAGTAEMKYDEDSFNTYGRVSFYALKANTVRAYWEWMPTHPTSRPRR